MILEEGQWSTSLNALGMSYDTEFLMPRYRKPRVRARVFCSTQSWLAEELPDRAYMRCEKLAGV